MDRIIVNMIPILKIIKTDFINTFPGRGFYIAIGGAIIQHGYSYIKGHIAGLQVPVRTH